MTVAIFADSPTLTSGFARTTRRMADALVRAGHDVACYGVKARRADIGTGLPYTVWPAEQGGHWTDTLAEFFASTRPEVLLLNMDAYNALECVEVCERAGWRGPTVSYVCFDGLPVSRAHLDAQRSCSAVWATSRTGAAYLESEGVKVAGYAPPGVAPEEFRPAADRPALRARAGLGDSLVVGVFATNTERKQVARAVAGFAVAAELRPDLDLRLYLHCRSRGYWDLRDLAARYGLADRVLFPAAEEFEEHRGVPTAHSVPRIGPGPVTGLAHLPEDFSYVDRINVCDVLMNVAHSGDVEQVIIEGQACGVPLLHTDDEAVMSDAVGRGGVLLPASDVGIGRIGQRLHYVSPRTIGESLAALLGDPAAQAEVRAAGLANAAAYPWSALEDAAVAMVAPYASPRAA
ncbi:hypothetical protein OG562_23245 [Streptomyces sp. NBC_01275]|uniref:hypothetical protein n=1 Tax=Streptomyces sp. NBC_01275 TaxID=2903807 RepID=UPI00225A7B72|nr:hypothetical protein [Streptomyces sp. NBC_01275]MCX4763830.1 hypothetical protein [Streptomyces sp. NBC_01275]